MAAAGRLARAGGAALACLAAFGLVWVNLAVGIIGSERNDANLLYAGVLAVVAGGALLARGRPGRLALVMAAAAVMQALIGATAVAAGWGADGPIWPRDVLGATALFTLLWLAAAALFRGADRSHDRIDHPAIHPQRRARGG